MKDDYLACYRVLGLQPGCSWAQLRSEYRKLVRQWHPDRFQHEPEVEILAEEKIKEINRAFESLSRYHDTFGSLPTASSGSPEIIFDSSPGVRTGQPQHDQFPFDQQEASAPDWAFDQLTLAKPKRFRFVRLALIGLVAWLFYAVWWPPSPATKSAQEEPDQQLTSAAADSETPAPETATAPPHGQRTFTVGSTRGQVLAAQGNPSDANDNVWHYGNSKVYFADGAVVRWVNDPRNPLRIGPDAPESSPEPNTFSLGSTKAQVKAIQGRPLLETDHEWDYGASKIYFKGDQVSGWYSSPFEPLRTSKQQAPQ